MENLDLTISEVINSYNGENLRMIGVNIAIRYGEFRIRALPVEVKVTDGVDDTFAFLVRISNNRKEINAYFTTDAFASFAGPVRVEFGYGGEISGVFKNIDLEHALIPLTPELSGIAVPNADSVWLRSQIDVNEISR